MVDNNSSFERHNIISLNKAQQLIQDFKEQGKKVGLCHGAFDLLHPGHVKHFESASRLCDILFVSLTSDEFVKQRKGEHRPIFNQNHRAYFVASLNDVDYVFISDFKTSSELIRFLKPNYYIKGPDYRNKQTKGIVSEREAIKSVGGRILYTNDPKFSTSEIIDKIKTIHRQKVLVLLDRDGTIIEKSDFLGRSPDWKKKVILKRNVVDLLHYINSRFDATYVVISNQAGVAWDYFDSDRVKEVNSYIDSLLKQEGIEIKDWKFSPYVDKQYAISKGINLFNPKYVRVKTDRKPSTEMVKTSLEDMGKRMTNFDVCLVIGDSEDDKLLAENLSCRFLDANKDYLKLKRGIDDIQ